MCRNTTTWGVFLEASQGNAVRCVTCIARYGALMGVLIMGVLITDYIATTLLVMNPAHSDALAGTDVFDGTESGNTTVLILVPDTHKVSAAESGEGRELWALMAQLLLDHLHHNPQPRTQAAPPPQAREEHRLGCPTG